MAANAAVAGETKNVRDPKTMNLEAELDVKPVFVFDMGTGTTKVFF